jgi:hypothetical protein
MSIGAIVKNIHGDCPIDCALVVPGAPTALVHALVLTSPETALPATCRRLGEYVRQVQELERVPSAQVSVPTPVYGSAAPADDNEVGTAIDALLGILSYIYDIGMDGGDSTMLNYAKLLAQNDGMAHLADLIATTKLTQVMKSVRTRAEMLQQKYLAFSCLDCIRARMWDRVIILCNCAATMESKPSHDKSFNPDTQLLHRAIEFGAPVEVINAILETYPASIRTALIWTSASIRKQHC